MTRTYGHRYGRIKTLKVRRKAAQGSVRQQTRKNAKENLKKINDGRKHPAEIHVNEIISNRRREYSW